MKTLTKQLRDAITPDLGIKLLKQGNKRFVDNLKLNRNLLQQVNETSEGQHPFAFILSCIDSRTSAELIFDQGLGDIFSCRIAGNILNEDILGSMEFACKIAGSKVIAVIGHSKCGAISGACDHVKLGNLTGLLQKIEPVIEKAKKLHSSELNNKPITETVASMNVKHVVHEIFERSPILSQMVNNEEIAIIGGMYDVLTGQVDFYEEEVINSSNEILRRYSEGH